jgi:hypothetical protein
LAVQADMCFSPEVDLVAGIVITGVGVESLRHAHEPRQIPLASLPIVFGTHQLVESVTWWSLQGDLPDQCGTVATSAYLAVALVVVPLLVPLAVALAERDPTRRRRLVPFALLGAAVALALGVQLAAGPSGASIGGRFIAYEIDLAWGGEITALYVLATCGPLLASGRPTFVLFGAANLTAVTALATLLATGLISLWCVWAAVTSVAVLAHLRAGDRCEEEVPAPSG